MGARRVAIVPARGGSKRLPRKNLLDVDGHPVVAYTVTAALDAGVFDRVVVSSDDADVLEAAARYGAEPLARPAALAGDDAPLVAAWEHLLDHEAARGRRYDEIALLMPNCPARVAEDVRAAARSFDRNGAEFQISATPYGWHYPFWAQQDAPDGAHFVFGESYLRPSQDLPTVACPTGAVWWARVDALRRSGTFYGPGYRLFLLPWERAIDVDDASDWEQFLTIRAGLLARGLPVPLAREQERVDTRA